jgi:acetyltransferase-like isoleucine patch superfamily enzyme
MAGKSLRADSLRQPLKMEDVLGRICAKAVQIADEYQARMRRRQLGHIARIDPTSIIGASARISNVRGNPDDLAIGPNCAILGDLLVFPQGGRIEMGTKCFVGEGTRIWSAASIAIGSYVLISYGVSIHDNKSHSHRWQERRLEMDRVLPRLQLYDHPFDLQAQPITIEDDVWIGYRASVLPGLRIGRGAIVGAGTIVTRDIEPHSVVAGNPMRLIRRLEQTR